MVELGHPDVGALLAAPGGLAAAASAQGGAIRRRAPRTRCSCRGRAKSSASTSTTGTTSRRWGATCRSTLRLQPGSRPPTAQRSGWRPGMRPRRTTCRRSPRGSGAAPRHGAQPGTRCAITPTSDWSSTLRRAARPDFEKSEPTRPDSAFGVAVFPPPDRCSLNAGRAPAQAPSPARAPNASTRRSVASDCRRSRTSRPGVGPALFGLSRYGIPCVVHRLVKGGSVSTSPAKAQPRQHGAPSSVIWPTNPSPRATPRAARASSSRWPPPSTCAR